MTSGGRAVGYQAALLHDGYLVGVGGGEREIVDDDQDGGALVALAAQDVEDGFLGGGCRGRR